MLESSRERDEYALELLQRRVLLSGIWNHDEYMAALRRRLSELQAKVDQLTDLQLQQQSAGSNAAGTSSTPPVVPKP